MRPGVEQNQKMAEGFVKEMTVGSKWKIALRMLMVRTLPKTPWKNLIAKKIRDGIQAAANAVPIEDYAAPAASTAASTATPATGDGTPSPTVTA